jgi:hypothetical protein
MPGSPNSKVAMTSADDGAEALAAAALESILTTQVGLEHLQRIIEDNTSPPARCSLAAINTAISGMLP